MCALGVMPKRAARPWCRWWRRRLCLLACAADQYRCHLDCHMNVINWILRPLLYRDELMKLKIRICTCSLSMQYVRLYSPSFILHLLSIHPSPVHQRSNKGNRYAFHPFTHSMCHPIMYSGEKKREHVSISFYLIFAVWTYYITFALCYIYVS